MAFHEVLFPPDISYGSSGGPKFKTTIFTANSGHEQRNIDWSTSRGEWDVSHSIKDQSAMDALSAFFMARGGRQHQFRFKDWNDYIIEDQQIGVGDSVTTEFQVVKTYVSEQAESAESFTYTRRILKLAWGTVEGVRVAGDLLGESEYTVDYTTGKITLFDPPYDGEAVVVDYAEFHVPARFDADHLDVSQDFWNAASWDSIEIVEARLPESGVTVTATSADAFHEVLLPTNIDFGVQGGPKFKTAIFTADSGFEAVNQNWTRVRGEWDVAHTVKTIEQMDELTAFFIARRGSAYGFRFKDWADYKVRQETIGYGDGLTQEFQVTKTYTNASDSGETWTFTRPLTKLAWNTLAGVTVAGVPISMNAGPSYPNGNNYYAVDENTGKITFRFAPDGERYSGTASVQTMDYITPGEGGIITLGLNTTPSGNGAFVDWTNGWFYRLGSASGIPAIQRIRVSDGHEDLQVTGPSLGLPGTLSSIIAVGPQGHLYVQCGAANQGHAVCKLEVSTGGELSLASTRGVIGSTPAPFGRNTLAGCVSNDGSMLLQLPVFNLADIMTVEADTLDTVIALDWSDLDATAIDACCPLFDSAFALLTTGSQKVRLYDNSGSLLLGVDTASSADGRWCVWDGGVDPGVVFGWNDSTGNHITKYSVETQARAWQITIPTFGGWVSNTSKIADQMAILIGTTVYLLNTADGTLRRRTMAASNPADNQVCNTEQALVVAYLNKNEVIVDIDVTDSSAELLPNAEVKIGYCEFHVPVRFDTDHLDVTQEYWNTPSWPSIPIVEVRDWSEIDFA